MMRRTERGNAMKRLLALLLLPALAACVQRDIPVPESGPGRQDAICAITFSQWLGISSHDVRVLGRSMNGANAVIRLASSEPPIVASCEMTPDYAMVSMTTNTATTAEKAD